MSNCSNVVLVFSANWCNPCKETKRYLENKDSDKYLIVDVTEKEDLASQYKIRNIPTLILTDNQGIEIERIIGFDKNKIDTLLDKVN